MSSVAPTYSVLCETNEAAYFAYLSEYSRWVGRNGERVGFSGRCYGRCCWGADGRRGSHLGDGTYCAITGDYSGRSGRLLDMDADTLSVAGGRCDCVGDCTCDPTESATGGVVGVPCGDSSGSGGGLAGAACGADGEAASVAVGESVQVNVGVDTAARGRNYKRNLRKKLTAARRRKDSGADTSGVPEWRVGAGPNAGGGGCAEDVGEVDALKASLDAKRIAENKLAEATAMRRLAVLEALAVEDEVKKRRTQVAAMTERNMVSMERDHAKLRASGNVPGVPGVGFAETLLSSGSDGLTDGNTISPNSSASMADLRKCQKDLLDSEAENEKLKAALERCGISVDHIDKYDKSVWTDNIETFDALDEMYGDYVLQPEEFSDKLRLVDTGVYGAPAPKTARAGSGEVGAAPVSRPARAREVVDVPEAGTGGVGSGDAAHFRKTDGTLYTQLEALRWLGSYAYAGNKLDCGRSDADVARECNTTVGVLQKYRSLKARFGLMQ